MLTPRLSYTIMVIFMLACACERTTRQDANEHTTTRQDAETEFQDVDAVPQDVPVDRQTEVAAIQPPPRYIVCTGRKTERWNDFQQDNRCAAINEQGQVKVPFEDEETRKLLVYDTGRFIFTDSEKRTGLLDADGNVVLAAQYSEIKRPSEGLLAVKDGQNCGYIDLDGKVVIAPQWHKCGSFHEERAWVMTKTGNAGYIDRQGQMVIDPIYTVQNPYTLPGTIMVNPSDFHDGHAAVKLSEHTSAELRETLGEKWGYIDRDGNAVTRFEFDSARGFSGGVAFVGRCPTGHKDAEEDCAPAFGLIDTDGKEVLSMTFGEAIAFLGDFAIVKVCDAASYFCTKPKSVPKRECYYPSKHCKRAILRQDGTWLLEPGRFREVGPFRDGRGFVESHDGWTGYVDETGSKVFAVYPGYPEGFFSGIARVPRHDYRARQSKRAKLNECHYFNDFVDTEGQPVFPFSVTSESRQNQGFDEHGIAVVEIRRWLSEHRHLVLHRERGVIWPEGWNEPGAGEGVLCWRENKPEM
ncbi:MAG: WG repeat-containing protein [Proteobacteria bacterium]|nr:WG repeat-containing protein [Pseudomonadota bacterium]